MKFLPDTIYIFVDGGVKNNGKKESIGAYSYILHLNGKEFHYSKAQKNTTNNQQELFSILNALKTLKRYDLPIIIFSDSQYAINCISKWTQKWKKNNWITSKKEMVKNKDILEELDVLISKFNSIKFEWVRGHNGNEYNEKCDKLCQESILLFDFPS